MSSDDRYLQAAAAIGRRIVADAIWHDERCNWVGAVADGVEPWRAQYRALSPNLYGGTAGVGLYLAQLAAETGEMSCRCAAIGAARHAVTRAPHVSGARRDGFHAGSLGVAWAAHRAAVLLGEEELHAAARSVVADARAPSGPSRCPDMAMGAAGSIVGLLALADAFDEAALVEDARAEGDELIRRATVTHHGWSWADPVRRYPENLCGLSHGAAGIGSAFVELFAATGEERFRAAATGAFAYERSWLDAGSGTWPDLRIGGQRRDAAARIDPPTTGSWCHGEAGIALTRLRAMRVLGCDMSAADAHVALDTTRRHLQAALPYAIEDFSLCHGAAGAADVLLCGAAELSGRSQEAVNLAVEAGDAALERHAVADEEWPCGVAGGAPPGLFRGLSGIGWWLLRLHDRATPSLLTVPVRALTRTVARP